MNGNNALLYGIVAVVAVLVFVGAVIAVGMFASPVYDVSLSLAANSTGAVYPYQSTVFNITVTNNGGKAVAGIPVAFYVNGVQKSYNTYFIAAHKSVSIQENYTYLGSGGYLFTAAADPGNVLRISNWTSARKSLGITSAPPEQADVYQSVPNSNITYTDSFTTSGSGLLTGSLMAELYGISAVLGINGPDGGILAKTYQDLYPYVAVANGAYSVYANGSASYAAWLQGTLGPGEVALIVSSFNKQVSLVKEGPINVEYSEIGNTTSLCSYYQGGWTKVIEFYNNSMGGTCLGMVGNNYTATESNVLVTALKGTRLGTFLTANQMNASKQIQWSRFYYVNATVLGQTVEYQPNAIAASTLFQLQNPTGTFLSRIKSVTTNVLAVNSTCLGLASDINGTDICSVILPTTGSLENQSFGAVYTRYISSNYTVEVYSLIGQAYLTSAHANAGELISRLGINSSSVVWHTPFKNSCGFESGFACNFNRVETNGSVNFTVTNLNYTTVRLNNITCEMAPGYPASQLNGTLARGESLTVRTFCHSLPITGFAAQTSFGLKLGINYRNTPMVINGTLNVTTSG